MFANPQCPPIIAFSAPGGTGKTTLLERVIAGLSAEGWRVGVIKQARPDFDLDQPAKDSYRLRKAGVERLLVAAERQSALIIEPPEPDEPALEELLDLFDLQSLDLVLVEGFRNHDLPRIALHRDGRGLPEPGDPCLIAVVGDRPLDVNLPQLAIDRPESVQRFIEDWCCEKME